MKTHELKVRPEFFEHLWTGDKKFEIRKNDRDFKSNDDIVLIDTEPPGGWISRKIKGFITYITDYEQKEGYVVFSFKITERVEE